MTNSREITDGWELALAAPGEHTDAGTLRDVSFIPAQVPGTAAGALQAAGLWDGGGPIELDEYDCWFRVRFAESPAASHERVFLELGGIATVSTVFLNGVPIVRSESMFAAHRTDVSDALRGGDNELVVHCEALAPLLRQARRPRARWRTRIVTDGNLRFFRTMLMGRAPGFAPGPPVVGPWRPVSVRRCRDYVLDDVTVRTAVVATGGLVRVSLALRPLRHGPGTVAVTVRVAGNADLVEAPLAVEAGPEGTVCAHGELLVPGAALWWPHTHGEPGLHNLEVEVADDRGATVLARRRIGFRSIRTRGTVERDGVQLEINGVPIFVRGAVWTPVDVLAPHATARDLDALLLAARDAGMNMLRVAAVGAYENGSFYERCDDLGILVWQDLMFANLDYPETDAAFMDAVAEEVRAELDRLGWRPSLAIVCGESEVAQQATMVGLDPELAHGQLFGTVLPALVQQAGVDAIYVPGTPCGESLPFRVGTGVSNYYGVGAYRRPISDARLAGVRFAAECLAFANIPGDDMLARLGVAASAVHLPGWKAGVPRDIGAGWDFDDVRDHYLAEVFGVDGLQLRSIDHERYLELSRIVTGEVMSEALAQWRRPGSGCGGALVLSFKDALEGAGWGLLDARSQPKSAYHYVRRAMAPVAVWSTDEGLDGIAIYVANDRPQPLNATLRVATYQDLERPVARSECDVTVEPHGSWSGNVEELLGCFADVSWAYRFGPPAQDVVAISLISDGGLVSQCFRLPAGRPRQQESAAVLGFRADAVETDDGGIALTVASTRFAYAVSVHAEGHDADDDVISVEPGSERIVRLRPLKLLKRRIEHIALSAVNLRGRVTVPVRER